MIDPISSYQVDALTDQPYKGNPACVWLWEYPADETGVQLVAREMNLSETSFLYPLKDGYKLRWLTPIRETNICGHATLACAHILWETDHLATRSDNHHTKRHLRSLSRCKQIASIKCALARSLRGLLLSIHVSRIFRPTTALI